MSKRIFIFSSTILILAMGVAALAAEEASREEALARELLEVTGGSEMGLQMMEQMMQSLAAQQPGLPPEFPERFLAEVDPTEIDDLLVPVYVKHLTAAEMEATLEFYRTPAGQSILQKMPLVMEESVRLGQQWGMEVAQRVVEKLEQEERADPTP